MTGPSAGIVDLSIAPLVVRDHHGGEIMIDVAGRIYLHADQHPRHRADIFGKERNFLRRRRTERSRAQGSDVLGQGRSVGGARCRCCCHGAEARG
jgi:hypothetical protein